MLRTENGIPLCQNTVPETCQPFRAYPNAAVSHSDWQLIDVLRIEIVPDVVVARPVVAGQFSRQGRENSSGGELQESPFETVSMQRLQV